MKRRIKCLAAKMSSGAIGARLTRQISAESINVVFAHHFGRDYPYLLPQGGTSLAALRRMLKILAERYRFCRLQELIDSSQRQRHERPRLAVTFDDGFDLKREGVIDLLREFGAPATFFVITDCIDNAQLMWRNKLIATERSRGRSTLALAMKEAYEARGISVSEHEVANPLRLARGWKYEEKDALASEVWERAGMEKLSAFMAAHRPYLTLRELHSLKAAGHEIGLHTRSHPISNRLTHDQVLKEYDLPLDFIKREFGLDQVAISYPFGIRLQPTEETRVFERNDVSCLLGINGMAAVGSPRWRWERADFEAERGYAVLAKPVVDHMKSYFRPAPSSA